MENQLKDLLAWFAKADSFELPSYKELPDVDLYMEQVLKYVNKTLSIFSPDDDKLLTSFMVNNYVKAKMIKEPTKKKYSKEQIGYLMAITIMKSTISMSDMSLLLELDQSVSLDKTKLYAFYSEIESRIMKEVLKKTKSNVDYFATSFEEARKKGDPKAEENLRNALGFLSLRLSIAAQANKMMSDRINSELRSAMHDPEAIHLEITPAPHEIRRENKISDSEAKRLAAAKNKELEELKKKAQAPKEKKAKKNKKEKKAK